MYAGICLLGQRYITLGLIQIKSWTQSFFLVGVIRAIWINSKDFFTCCFILSYFESQGHWNLIITTKDGQTLRWKRGQWQQMDGGHVFTETFSPINVWHCVHNSLCHHPAGESWWSQVPGQYLRTTKTGIQYLLMRVSLELCRKQTASIISSWSGSSYWRTVTLFTVTKLNVGLQVSDTRFHLQEPHS